MPIPTLAKPHILIVGAGLGGLTAAIALSLRGFAVDVYEQAAELREVGAGLSISRSAQAVFAEIGLLDRIAQGASLVRDMAFLHYRSGALIAGSHDRGDGAMRKGVTGGLQMHRADLHALLVARFADIAPGRLHLGRTLLGFTDASGPVRLSFADGSGAGGDMLIGADGVRSVVRRRLWGEGRPRFTGQVAYRFMVGGDVAAPFIAEHGRVAVFQGPGKVFNRYTLRRGAVLNCVGIARSDSWHNDDWSTPASPEEMLELYAGWHPTVTALMAIAPPEHTIKWALFDRPPLPGWLRGRTTLLGDAAHPMLPFLGLGAAMAVEDAMILARALDASPDTDGLSLYEDVRRPRVERIADLSRLQGELSQATDPDRYDAGAAPAQDPGIANYDPVTVPLGAG